MGPTVFRPYLRRIESLTVLSYLKTLSIVLAGVCTHDLHALSRPALSQLSQSGGFPVLKKRQLYLKL